MRSHLRPGCRTCPKGNRSGDSGLLTANSRFCFHRPSIAEGSRGCRFSPFAVYVKDVSRSVSPQGA